MTPDLKNKSALVVGGSRGIGAAIVRRFAREGAHVAFTFASNLEQAESTAKQARESGVKILPIRADSGEQSEIQSAVSQTVATHGGLDILIVNAGVAAMAPVYAMSKAGLVGLVKGLARDLGPRGITVNNVQPGPVDTDMNPARGDFADMLREVTAVGRYGHSDEIAAFVAFLADTEAAYVTGASLTIDGGFTA